ncbi:MAG TPA: hypothetical protein VNI20_13425 [Fimbriimonadaceae bacterium]|nr:hypothetical protein [Fimbriimonadaceae bacterium]
MLRPTALALGVIVTLVTPAFAQKATPEQMGNLGDKSDYGTMHFNSNLGSFRMIDGEGRVEIDFTGTILVNKLQGSVQVSGNLKKEFDGMKRTVYHGTGHMVVSGQFRAIQWFGSDMTGVWYGKGIIRLLGEFDRNLSTGEYWYDDPVDKGEWPSVNTFDYYVPEHMSPYAEGSVKRRDSGGN